jgi:hypothetical protein
MAIQKDNSSGPFFKSPPKPADLALPFDRRFLFTTYHIAITVTSKMYGGSSPGAFSIELVA